MKLSPIWNPNNKFCVVRVHYTADPDKDNEAWMKRAHEGVSEQTWNREYEISYDTFEGKPVYQDFKEHHIGESKYRPGINVYRGWDFGYHHPACLFAFFDNIDRLCVVKEVLGHDEGIRDFISRVLRLSQQWFPDCYAGKRFLDTCDPAGQQPLSGESIRFKEGKQVATTSVDILNDMGVFPTSKGTEVIEGLEIIRQRLQMRNDGQYGIVVSHECPVLIDGFKGGYRYQEPKAGVTEKEEPLKDGYYDHLHDCLRYIVVNYLNVAPSAKVHIEDSNRNSILDSKAQPIVF